MPVLTLLVALSFASLQSPAPFDGNWIAEYRGTTYVRLSVHTANGVTSGTLSLGNVEFDKTGAVAKAAEAPRTTTPIFDVRRSGDVLTFARKEGEDTDRFELSRGADGLELKFLPSEEDLQDLADAGIPAPKPFRLMRSK